LQEALANQYRCTVTNVTSIDETRTASSPRSREAPRRLQFVPLKDVLRRSATRSIGWVCSYNMVYFASAALTSHTLMIMTASGRSIGEQAYPGTFVNFERGVMWRIIGQGVKRTEARSFGVSIRCAREEGHHERRRLRCFDLVHMYNYYYCYGYNQVLSCLLDVSCTILL
jgi:hypothetical protein